jgi:peroxiredoxin
MSEQKEQSRLGRLIIISAIMLAAVLIYTGCKKKAAEPANAEQHQPEPAQPEPVAKPAQSEPVTESTSESAKKESEITTSPKVSLKDIIKAAKTWGPAYKSWYGKPAPDFTLTDLAGNEHKLSDYRGKDIMIIFWATWCPPCKIEVPDLIELRKTTDQENLAMLAISDEDPALVKKFVADQKLNYTVLLDKGNMPAPFGVQRIYTTTGIPGSFFIDPQGKIKLATAGLLSLREIKAILKAE